MKNYKIMLIGSIVFYLLAAMVTGYSLIFREEKNQFSYLVDINRIMHQLDSLETWQPIDVSSYPYVKQVEFLDGKGLKQEQLQNFYIHDKHGTVDIRPWLREDQFKGYVKFTYEQPRYVYWQTFLLVELALALLEGLLIVLLYYFKKRFIEPVYQMNESILQFASGHYKSVMKQDKNSYLSSFQLGIAQLKDRLEVSKKRQLELEKEKKRFLLSLSHEMKSPLNLIKLYAKALDEGLYQDETRKHYAIKKIGEKANEIEECIDEIMRSSREDIIDIEIVIEEFYLHELVEKIRSSYQEQCELRMMDLHIASYEDIILKGDLSHLQEVMENLFENAFKYGDGRSIELSFEVEEYHQLIRFYNSGEPVNEQDLNHIFESFYRGGNSLGKQGSGLGLYISREIMRKMQGNIYVEKEEAGMRFVLVLPE